jgi:hypothetical protein
MYQNERIAAVTMNRLDPSAALRDTTTKDSVGPNGEAYIEREYGLRSWKMAVEGLVLYNSKNLLAYSEDLSQSIWTKTGCTAAFGTIEAPNGTLTGNTVSGFSGADSVRQILPGAAYNSEAKTYTFSIWVKGTATQTVVLTLGDSADSATQTVILTTAWQLAQVSYTTDGDSSDVYFGFDPGTATSFNPWGAQIEEGSAASQYKPSGKAWHTLLLAEVNQTKLDMVQTDQTDTHMAAVGQVLVSNFTHAAPMHENQTFTCDLEGTGSLTPTLIEP